MAMAKLSRQETSATAPEQHDESSTSVGEETTEKSPHEEVVVEEESSTKEGPPNFIDSPSSPQQINGCWLASLIMLLGSSVTVAFLGLGISSTWRSKDQLFQLNSETFVEQFRIAWKDYEMAAQMTHHVCSSFRNDARLNGENAVAAFPHRNFRELYENLNASGIDVQIEYLPRVMHRDREAYEAHAKAHYSESYPGIEYRGFTEIDASSNTMIPRSQQEYYYPVQYMEPVIGSENVLGLDALSLHPFSGQMKKALETWSPVLSPPAFLFEESNPHVRAVHLNHPGTKVSTQPDLQPTEVAVFVIRMPDLIRRAFKSLSHSIQIYLYDETDLVLGLKSEGYFLAAQEVRVTLDDAGRLSSRHHEILPEIAVEDIVRGNMPFHEQLISIADRKWRVVLLAMDDTYDPVLLYVIVGGMFMFLCTMGFALWAWSYIARETKIKEMRLEAEQEKAEYVLVAAKKSAEAERALNEFLSHEVRNPISSALSACMFVKSAVFKGGSIENPSSVKDDVTVIENSLCFINDLLRNILDTNRAANGQLTVVRTGTDILQDILVPVNSMLQRRGSPVQVIVDCPEDLVVETDPLRLKQVILNLGRNSAKFVERGYIRLCTRLDENGCVEILVEDSGPGVPYEKKRTLFSKFQASLDNLSQGTGVGLYLCKKLVNLMGGSIWLDEAFDSGIEGCPGARIVVSLNTKPCDVHHFQPIENPPFLSEDGKENEELPPDISVLFVDDDLVVRRMFARAVKRVAPSWNLTQASSGEAALQIVKESRFDLIFMDMYMASAEKQLLGTETVQELRSMGVDSIICGASANNIGEEFKIAGADAFLLKPFPFTLESLKVELRRILLSRE